jgi:hypothetical protein
VTLRQDTPTDEAGRAAATGLPLPAWLDRFAGRARADVWAWALIVGVVVVANGLYVLGVFDPNPLGPRSGLLRSLTPGVLRGLPTIDPNVGFISQAVSHRAALDLLHLHIPLWNPFEGTGAPLLGEMQSAALFPLTLLTAFANGQLYEHMLLEMLAGISTYALLRRIAVGRVAATAAGTAFALNGTFAWFAHSTVNPVAFLPLLLLGFELAYAATLEGRPGGWWLIALANPLSVYAGFPEVAYLDALFCVPWIAWRCASLGFSRARGFLLRTVAGTVVATLLCAPALIAMVDYFNHADLWLHVNGIFSHVHVPARTIPQLLMPYAFGPIAGFADPKFVLYAAWVNVGGYLSTSLLVLGLLGLFSSARRGLRLILVVWILVMIARIYGTPVFVGDAVNLLPGLSNAAVFRYVPPSVEFAAVILAALGLDDLINARASRRRIVLVSLGSMVVLAGAVLVAIPLANQLGIAFSHRPYFVGSIVWAAGIILVIAAVALFRSQPRLVALAGAVMVLDALVLFAIPELSAPRAVSVDMAPVDYLKQHLGTSRYFTLGPLAPNYGSYFGLASVNAVDVPVPSAFEHFVNRRLDPAVDPTEFVGNVGGGRPLTAPSPEKELLSQIDGYREAGVSYVLTSAGQALPERGFGLTLVLRTPSTRIYHLAGAQRYMSTTNPGCDVSIEGRESARTICARATTLIRRETKLPGWRATIDGDTTPIHTYDGVFQTIHVPAGVHKVSFDYSPRNVGWGWLAFLLGLVALLLDACRRAMRAR